MYKMELKTAGENILAQKILLSKGYQWIEGQKEVLYEDEGQYLFLEDGTIGRTSLLNDDWYDQHRGKEIGFGELAALHPRSDNE